MDPRARRLAEKQALFREINERSRPSVIEVQAHQHMNAFICECADGDCRIPLALTGNEYERVRSQASWFIVAAGHTNLAIGRVIESNDRFEMVELTGEAAKLAEQWDPRARADH